MVTEVNTVYQTNTLKNNTTTKKTDCTYRMELHGSSTGTIAKLYGAVAPVQVIWADSHYR